MALQVIEVAQRHLSAYCATVPRMSQAQQECSSYQTELTTKHDIFFGETNPNEFVEQLEKLNTTLGEVYNLLVANGYLPAVTATGDVNWIQTWWDLQGFVARTPGGGAVAPGG